jgi:hypothetical protein
MSLATVTVSAQWALHGQAPDTEGTGILSCSSGELGKTHFRDALGRFALAGVDELPQVAVSYLKHGTQPGTSYVALAVGRHADAVQRYGDALAARDGNGRETTFTSYFCAPYAQVAQAGVTYLDLYAAVSGITLPVTDGPPQEVAVTTSATRAPAVNELPLRTAALLLTGLPVCVVGAESTRMEERLYFIDTVMDLLPYGFRARMAAATWMRATNRDHKFRLFFSSAPRPGGQPDHVVTWNAAEQVEIPAGPPGDYYESLTEKLNPISQLRGFTDELRFGSREAATACELLDTGRYRVKRPAVKWLGGDRRLPSASRPVEVPGPETVALRRPAQLPHEQVPRVQAADPVEHALVSCAGKIKDGNPSGLRADIRWLDGQARLADADEAHRARYRALLSEHQLLAPHPELKKLQGDLYAALVALAFGTPVSYDGYCKIERCLGVERGARLPEALLNAIYHAGIADVVATALVLARLDTVDLYAWLKSGAADGIAMINMLARSWDHAAHAQVFCDVTLTYLRQFPEHYDRAAVRKALRQRGYLARALAQRYPDNEQYQYFALTGFLTAAYPQGLARPAILQVLSGGNNPPTPALFAAVLGLLASPADGSLAAQAYAYGAATLLAVDTAESKRLAERVPPVDQERRDGADTQAPAEAAQAPAEGAAIPLRSLPHDPTEAVLLQCARQVRAKKLTELRKSITALQVYTAHATASRRYRRIVVEQQLLRPEPGLGDLSADYYDTMVRLAYGSPLDYDRYCQLMDDLTAAGQEEPRPRDALLLAIDRAARSGQGDEPDLRVTALVAARLDPGQRESRFAVEKLDAIALLGLLAGQWDRPQHAELVLDATVAHLAAAQRRMRSQDRAALLDALKTHRYLAPALRLRYPASEHDQIAALTKLIDAVYPGRLDEPTAKAIVAPEARTSALLLVVSGKTDDPKVKAWIGGLFTAAIPVLRLPEDGEAGSGSRTRYG